MSLIPKKGTVYVVDDDEAVRDSLQWLLEGKDYRVRCFESSEAFLSRPLLDGEETVIPFETALAAKFREILDARA